METITTSYNNVWSIDPMHSQIGFKVKHLMFTNVRGKFNEYSAQISTIGNDFTSVQIGIQIESKSINTNDEKRDEHLKSPDFFDVEQFKTINFKSDRIEKTSKSGYYNLFGELTIKGIRKPIRLEVESGGIIKDPWGDEKAIFNVSGRINRKEWDLNWNASLEAGGVLVSDDVWLNCEIQLVHAL